jgi:hypothetical protein
LILFLTDGRIEMDSNAVERTIRPIALQRKNALFAGHDAGAQNWAMLASLIETCKLNKIEPHSYLTVSSQPSSTAISRNTSTSCYRGILEAEATLTPELFECAVHRGDYCCLCTGLCAIKQSVCCCSALNVEA